MARAAQFHDLEHLIGFGRVVHLGISLRSVGHQVFHGQLAGPVGFAAQIVDGLDYWILLLQVGKRRNMNAKVDLEYLRRGDCESLPYLVCTSI